MKSSVQDSKNIDLDDKYGGRLDYGGHFEYFLT